MIPSSVIRKSSVAYYNISYDNTIINISSKGDIQLILNKPKSYQDNIKAAAMAIIRFCIEQKSLGFNSFIINKVLEIDFSSATLTYLCDDESQLMTDIINQFNKYKALKAFW
jgi:hypothetical protein